MDWTPWIPLFVAMVAVVPIWLQLRNARQSAADQAEFAAAALRAAADVAAAALAQARSTELKLEDVATKEQLDGQLTRFRSDLEKRILDAFARGRAAGAEAAIVPALAEATRAAASAAQTVAQVASDGQAKIEEHLRQQDADNVERHEEVVAVAAAAPPSGPNDRTGNAHQRRAGNGGTLDQATKDAVEAVRHEIDLDKDKGGKP